MVEAAAPKGPEKPLFYLYTEGAGCLRQQEKSGIARDRAEKNAFNHVQNVMQGKLFPHNHMSDEVRNRLHTTYILSPHGNYFWKNALNQREAIFSLPDLSSPLPTPSPMSWSELPGATIQQHLYTHRILNIQISKAPETGTLSIAPNHPTLPAGATPRHSSLQSKNTSSPEVLQLQTPSPHITLTPNFLQNFEGI